MFRNVSNQPLYELSTFIKPHISRACLAGLMLILAAASMLALPSYVKDVVDSVLSRNNNIQGNHLMMFAFAASLVALLSSWRYYLVSTLGEHVVADIRKCLFQRILSLDSYQFETMKVGEMLSRITTDTALIEIIVSTSISLILRNTIMLTGSVILMLYTSWRLTIIVIVVTPIVIIPLAIAHRFARKFGRLSQDKLAVTNSYAGEVIYAAQVAQAFNQEKYHYHQFSSTIVDTLITAKKRIRLRTIYFFILTMSAAIAVMLVFVAGSQLVTTDPPIISQGELVMFIGYTLYAVVAFNAISDVSGDIQRASGAAERIVEILHAQPKIVSPKNPIKKPEKEDITLVFDKVSFCYPAYEDKAVLRNVSLKVKPGEMVALVGPSGAGKSTIMQLLLRFYQHQQGEIKIANHNNDQYKLDDLRSLIAIVPQEVIIFSGTIYENIQYGRPDATEKEVIAAAEMALVDKFVETLPNGYHTEVGERGLRLSGGQKQRLAIARAFLRDSPVLLLDEATSALDAESERLVQQAINTLIRNRTTLVIAHRLATIKQADNILFIDQGEIKATGKHDDLVKKNKAYANLSKLQFIK